ncbi:HI0933 family protein [Denitrovibrio acetiphilus DSM 12809]|uniref:HI0933 family protein n=1 Tax=Denitrovibrio acetiphilus (strain DSM 12809 / NBRC 114555 / N2460) TaxID=522772 RepID=D4H1X4_DENA2|nr:NAD(P)/FAD-dependent oxidoreductase [Denitrovibrio acetiphilus]ADD66951.1 HI0933 family protein [Denitrovibrio acetiphilus DSM 12809]
MKIYDVIVIGGGPAGMMAAGTAGENGASVLLLEKMGSLGRKLLISGSGRCNLTNTITVTKDFVEHFGKKGRFLYPALNGFSTTDTISFFNGRGLVTTVEKDFKIFPESETAAEVLSVLTRYMKENRVDIRQGVIIKNIHTADNIITSVELAGNEVITCKSLIITTGGNSYPKTGSSGDGYRYAADLGHNIITPAPALVPVIVKESWVKELQGLSLRGARLAVYKENKKIAEDIHDAVFTDNGLSGPAVYNLTRKINVLDHDIELRIDQYPEDEYQELDCRVASYAEENSRKTMKKLLEKFFPPKMLPLALQQAEIDPDMRAGHFSKSARRKIVGMLKNMKLTVERFAGFEKAVITSGGVDLKEIDGKTMSSKLIGNLYFAGEVIDIDGPTGGFNLQICWSTGRLAGQSAAASIYKE